jgi:hypothetical protein
MIYSDAYVDHLSRGPFPSRIDPWGEIGLYFQQIHAGIINDFLDTFGKTLLRMGYIAGRERSLQIIEPRQPDVSIRAEELLSDPADAYGEWNYIQAAIAISAEPGITVTGEYYDLEAIHIKTMESSELVTVIEIISPSNKTHWQAIEEYTDQRNYLVRAQNVNFVEIDLTRSVKRLLHDKITTTFAYHIAIHISHQLPRVIGMSFEESIKRFALPLRREVVLVEPQILYDNAYRTAAIAAQIRHEGRYSEADLPFSSLLTDQQRGEALSAVERWMNELEHLK